MFVQGPCESNSQNSDSFGLLHSGDIPGYLLPELSGGDTLFTQTDLTPPGSGGIDCILKSPQVSHQDSSAIQNSKPAGVHPSQPQIRPSSACNCVRQITEKLATFKTLSVYPQRFQPDFVLTVARDSLLGWRPYLQCPSCQQSDDKDILILSVMALRALLNLIQEIDLRRKYEPQRDNTEEEAPTETALSAPFLDCQNSFLGTYPLACEEKRLLVDLLLYRTLKSLGRTAKSLGEKSLTMARTPSKSDSESSQSSRSQSFPSPPDASPTVYYGLPDILERSCRTERLDSTGFNVSPDEHDNYIQKSLQDLTSHIESLLLTIQNAQKCHGQDDADTFGI